MSEKWKEIGIKDKIQYIIAIVLFISGIALAFLNFALTLTVATGSLIYISEAFITGAGIFGVSIYFKSKLGEFKSDTAELIEKVVKRVIDDKE